MMSETSILNASFGQGGIEFVNDTAVHSGNFVYLLPLSDCVFATLTGQLVTGNSMIGVTFPKGIPIPGNISSISLTSGSLYAVKGL